MIYQENDKGSGICERDGVVSTTYVVRDVGFLGRDEVVRDILVGACDKCGDTISVPAQSTPAIAEVASKFR